MYRRLLWFYRRGVDALDRWTSALCALLLAAVVLLTGSENVGRSLFAQSSVAMVDLALQFAAVDQLALDVPDHVESAASGMLMETKMLKMLMRWLGFIGGLVLEEV